MSESDETPDLQTMEPSSKPYPHLNEVLPRAESGTSVAPLPAPTTVPPAGGVHHVRNNSGKKNGVVYTPVLSLGDHKYEIMKDSVGGSIDEEVAGMVSRMVHYVSFGEATATNSDLLLELEEYQEECWGRERTRYGGDTKRASSSRSGSKGRSKRGTEKCAAGGGSGGGGAGAAPKRNVLEEELYLSSAGLSLQSSPTAGFATMPRGSDRPAKRNTTADTDTAPTSAFASLSAAQGDHQQDAFWKKMSELQWLQADTSRAEKVTSSAKGGGNGGGGGGGSGGGSRETQVDSQGMAPRSRTPPRTD